MELAIIKFLQAELGDKYVSSNDLFLKSLNAVAVPTMGTTKATLWIVADGVRGEDIVRRHYETMLKSDSQLSGKESPIDPYNGPRELALRLKQQGFNMEMTIFPPDYPTKMRYLELKRKQLVSEGCDIQAVCYNLDNVAILEEDDKLVIDGIDK